MEAREYIAKLVSLGGDHAKMVTKLTRVHEVLYLEVVAVGLIEKQPSKQTKGRQIQ